MKFALDEHTILFHQYYYDMILSQELVIIQIENIISLNCKQWNK